MKVLVAYFSKTGNTKKVAQAIHDTLDVPTDMLSFDDVSFPDEYDLIFCGFPVHAHSVPPRVQTFISRLPKNKKVALFSTHGSRRNNQMARAAVEHAASLAIGRTVLGAFACRGQVDHALLDELTHKQEHEAWCNEARSADGHPNKGDLADAADFARLILARAR
ncbi:MAG: hypothetical protein JW884_13200 [Deltaproteobacteria bacterium]|nr:hypothetical protein [Deltaproteobacteria bacterium]